MSFQPELGQMAFGNPTGEHACPHWVDALVKELLSEIGRVFWNENQREWNGFEDPKITGIEFRPYYWGEDEDEAAKSNFKHGDIEVRWYKHPGRSTSLNVEATPEVIISWFESALDAIHASGS